MGVSPDCSDMQFAPGGTSSRDGFSGYFAVPLYPLESRTYAKSYVDPKGNVFNLYFYSNGAITVENVTTTSGVEALLSQTSAPGSWAKSTTAFGREYIAISDTLHGAEIPLQFDGVNLDRVTQDGPGASPQVISLPLPSVSTLNSVSPPATLTISGIFPDQRTGGPSSPFSTLNIYVTGSTAAATVGTTVSISGTGSPYDGVTAPVILNPGPGGAITVSAYSPGTATPYNPGSPTGTLTIGTGVANTVITRVANIVTVQTQTAHQLQPGYRAQLAGVAAAVIGTSIVSIKIDNEDNAGIATVTTTDPHGLVPGLNVGISGVVATAVGTSIISLTRTAQVVTVLMSGSTGLSPGGIVTVSGVPTASFNTIAPILNVTTTTVPNDTFTYAQIDVDAVDSSGTGTVALNWPIPNTLTPTIFSVESAPTPTTFQVQVNYPDGSWTGGTVTYAWDGIFQVATVPTPTSFTYQQYGPDATVVYVSGQTVTPYGQAAPGKRQMTCFFITRQGYTTRYSPPVTVVTNGGQYLSVSNIPIGPSNVVARVIAFTGAEGAYFYYIPAPPQVNGQLVGTSTVINDNTTTSITLDFSDPTLFAGLGISLAGNNLANQTIIDGALGFARYASRLITYGQRNNIQNLLNVGFDGGYQLSAPTLPTGWNGGGSGSLAAGHYGGGWTTSGTPLTQSFYEDFSGAPIALGNTAYTFRAWVSAAGTVTATISSASASFSTTATLSASAAGWYEHVFSAKTPASIASDITLGITGSGIIVDEMSIIYTDTPYATTLLGSYVDNPEAFDGVSGRFGPVDDTHQTLALGIIRSNLYLLTRDPSGRLHQTTQGNTEPSGWTVDEVGQNCGTVSAFSLTVSQANDNTGGGGEEWFAWYSSSGPRIFGGEFPFKIAQEIMRSKGTTPPGAPQDLSNINTAAQTTVWALNDPVAKIMYFGVPMNVATAPNKIWMMSYLGCESASEIASQDPVHRAVNTGKMIANDLGRKWTPWNISMNTAALLYGSDGGLQPYFCGGSGQYPRTLSGTVNTATVGPTSTSAVSWVSGDKFTTLLTGQSIVINGSTVQVIAVLSSTAMAVTTALGSHLGVTYSAKPGPVFGNIYTLDPALLTDDDYGLIQPYYTTSPLPDPELAQGLGIGGGLKMCSYAYGLISGTGIMTISILYNLLSKEWRIDSSSGAAPIVMNAVPDNDTEWGCGQATGKRFWFRFESTPNTGTDNAFELNNWTVAIKKNPRMPVRGSNR